MPQGTHLRTLRDTAEAVRAAHQFSTCNSQVCEIVLFPVLEFVVQVDSQGYSIHASFLT